MTRPDRLPDRAKVPERLTYTRGDVELTALAAILDEKLGVPVVLGGRNPRDARDGVGHLTVRSAVTGEQLDVEQSVLDEALAAYVEPEPSGPAAELARSAATSRTVNDLANAIVAYAVAISKGS